MMLRHGLPADQWRKSTYSEGAGNECVETQPTDDGFIALGDSKTRSRGALVLGQAAWQYFVGAVRSEMLPK
jgi:hypothetical protein